MGNYADIILEGGSFYLGKGLDSDVDFVAVKGNSILAVGKKEDMDQLVSPDTKVYSFTRDNLIMAGIHDNHIHMIQAALLDKYVGLYESKTEEEAAQMVADFAKTIPDEEWVMGMGFMNTTWKGNTRPTCKSLDAVIPDRPVFLLDMELHLGWINSKAMEICGITKDTPDPEGGIIGRFEDGTPNGELIDNGISLCGKYAFDFDNDMTKALINRYVNKYTQYGITSISDMTPYLSLDLSYPEVYFDMVKNDELKIRVNAARNLFEDIEVTKKYRDRAEKEGKGMYKVRSLKQFIDGTPYNFTGMLLAPYVTNPDTCGAPNIDIEAMNKAVLIATENDFSVRLHACGDGSTRAAFDAYEAGYKAFPESKSRHMIEHIECIDPADLPRFKELGVIASVQPEHPNPDGMLFADNGYPAAFGPEREQYLWAFKSMLDAGAVIAAGSDNPVCAGNPFMGLYVGNLRCDSLGLPEGGWIPKEKLSVKELLDAYTAGAAYAEGREDELGTLEAGKLADIAVIDRNLLEMDGNPDLRNAVSVLTIVDGKVVYEA